MKSQTGVDIPDSSSKSGSAAFWLGEEERVPAEMLSVGFALESFLLARAKSTRSFPPDDNVEVVSPYHSCPTP